MKLKSFILTIGFIMLFSQVGLSQQLNTAGAKTPTETDDKVLAKLIEMLGSNNETVRLRAAEMLIDDGPEEVDAMELLAALTDSSNEKLRQKATIALNQIVSGRRITRAVKPSVNADPEDEQAEPKPDKPAKGKLIIANTEEVNNQSTFKLKLDASKAQLTDGRYVISVTNGDETKEIEKGIISEKNKPPTGQEIPIKLFAGKNKITVYPKVNGKELRELAAEREIVCNYCEDYTIGQTTNFRAVVGLEQVGASSANGGLQIW